MGQRILSMMSTVLQFAANIFNTYIEPYAGWWFSAVIICTVYRFLLYPLLAGGWGSDPVTAVKQVQAYKRKQANKLKQANNRKRVYKRNNRG